MSSVAFAAHPTPLACLHYDRLAGVYDRHWAERFTAASADAVASLIEPEDIGLMRVLDVCCGAGHIAESLAGRGWTVTGVDGSERLLESAAARVPGALLVMSDVTEWLPSGPFDATICTCDSINSIIDRGRLARMLENVRAGLVNGGSFVFDFNMADAYESDDYRHSQVIEGDRVIVLKGRWDAESQLGHTSVTAFVHEHAWRRIDAELVHRCYEPRELWALLTSAGFAEIAFWPASALGIQGTAGRGRWFGRARVI